MSVSSLGTPLSQTTQSRQSGSSGTARLALLETPKKCDATSVRSLPLGQLESSGKPLPMISKTPYLVSLQAETASHLLNAGAKAQTPPKKEEKKGNLFQRGIRFVGNGLGTGIRAVGDGAGWTTSAVIKNNPVALASRASSGVAEWAGAPKDVTNFLGAADKASEGAGNFVKSGVRGVSEFGAGTVEGVAELAADPAAAAKGIGIAATSGLDAVPVVGDWTTGTEAMLRGKKLDEVREEKRNNRSAIWQGLVAEHKEVEGRVGTVGAWTKVALDVGTLVKSSALTGARSGGQLGRAGNLAEEGAELVVRRSDSDMSRGAGKGTDVVKKPSDKVAAASPSVYEYTPSAARGSEKLDIDAEKIFANIAKEADGIRSVAPEATDLAKFAEPRAIATAAREAVDNAVRDGRLGYGAKGDRKIQEVTEWLIVQELKAGGAKLAPETLQYRMPYKVSEETFSSGVQKKTLAQVDGEETGYAFMAARRALQKEADVVPNGNKGTRVLNGSELDVFIATSAIDDMRRVAPKLAGSVGEIQFEKTLSRSVYKEVTEVDGKKVKDYLSLGTAGYVMKTGRGKVPDLDETIVIQKTPGRTGTKAVQNLRELYGKDIPDARMKVGQVKGTIFHETAHLLDDALDITKDPNTLFGQGQKTGTAINSPKSRDFVSNYAQTNAAEDFAETVRFIIDLQTQSRPTGLSGPVTDTLRGKLLKASEVIGSDPKVLEVLPGW